jgi:pimeloyl-ACP methyl ester carboxylesterase
MISSSVSAPSSLPFYGSMAGDLFLYHAGKVAFESALAAPNNSADSSALQSGYASHKCILIGGLSDGMWPVPYSPTLDEACKAVTLEYNQQSKPSDEQAHSIHVGWSLVQPVIRSSYTGFGHSSLDNDAEDLLALLDYLVEHREAKSFAIVGHSTGCQDIMALLENKSQDDRAQTLLDKIKLVVLQAPVSDREGPMEWDAEKYKRHLEIAKTMQQEGRQEEMMTRDAFWAPITAQRYLDLNERGGRDDYFSSDYTDAELQDRLGHVGKYSQTMLACLVACSGADEYVPSTLDSEAHCNRMCQAMNQALIKSDGEQGSVQVAKQLYLKTANHNLSQETSDQSMFVSTVREWLVKSLEAK